MKEGNSHKPTGIKAAFVAIALVSLTLITLILEKAPRIAPNQPQERLSDPIPDEHEPRPAGRHISGGTTPEFPPCEVAIHIPYFPSYVGEGHELFELVFVSPNLKLPRAIHAGCNYAKGKWVADKKRPLYSGFECKQWLSAMWACRLTQRKDFSYEQFRWQPEGCHLPEFVGSEFLQRMQDKTIALVGDSLGREQFQSLMCMVTGGREDPEVEDIGPEYGLVLEPGNLRPSGWAYRFCSTNTTILFYWSATLSEVEPLNISDPETSYAFHLDRPAKFLQQYLHRFNVLVLNTGHHWNRGKFNVNRWIMYLDGKPLTNRKLAPMMYAKNFTIHSIVKWLDSQLQYHRHLKAFLRSISPRHFVNGEWNTGGSCDSTTPLSSGSEVTQDSSSDPVAESAVEGTRVKLLDITALSQLRDEGHISKYSITAAEGVQDCLHWCLPGIPDAWNEILVAQL